MANYTTIVTLASATGETADSQVNTFAFTVATTLGSGGADTHTGFLKALYDELRTAGALLGLAQNGHTVKFYNAVTTVPNLPLFERTFNLNVAPSAIDLPLEVSLCISYANDSAVSVPARRRRGRIYISGFNEASNTAGRPVSSLQTALVTAYMNYVDSVNGQVDAEACVWSRSAGALYPLERIWCDNEWDTMRSRGGKSTSRVTEMVA